MGKDAIVGGDVGTKLEKAYREIEEVFGAEVSAKRNKLHVLQVMVMSVLLLEAETSQ